ncbi:MAG: cysteine--tRNA ligase [Alphaproteobacteria bacterium]|nr:cysteine--tRNA ligase [Alphaproteobacteria bacterium]
MTLYLTNTLTRKKEEFIPIDKNNVGMYVCGPTVYDRAHIGNARPVVVFDTLYRLLKQLYPNVTYVRNITDVDDKIINRSKESGEPIDTITKRTTQDYHDDMAELNALSPDEEPRATECIDDMIEMIEALIEKGYAYAADGHALFSVSKMPEYGKLSGRSMDEMIAGARVEIATYKKNPADFVLWKPSSDDQPGWNSPWGYGRPGWHIECSAMSKRFLGEVFDIHGGGVDLVFPHHENEIAQSCCAHDNPKYANYWVHNGHLMVEGEKMSKSLGNFFTVNELLEKVPGEVMRFYMLTTHYHQPLNWTNDGLMQAKQIMDKFYTGLRKVKDVAVDKADIKTPAKVMEALKDDLNTPLAISHLHELLSNLNKATNNEEKANYKAALLGAGKVLGLFEHDAEEWFKWQPTSSSASEGFSESDVEKLIAERAAAKAAKDFATSDKIRDDLLEMGIKLEDSPQGTTWSRV